MASRIFAEFTSTKEPKKARAMIKYVLIIIYWVMFVIMAVAVWWHAGGQKYYRTMFAIILGLFWPIPAAILFYMWIESMMNMMLNWFDRNKN